MQTDHKIVWDKCLAHIRGKVTETTFNTWFSPVVPSSCEGERLTLQVPSQYFYEYLENNHVDVLRDAVHCVIGENASLTYLVGAPNTPASLSPRPKSTQANTPFTQAAVPHFSPQLIAKYTLDNFLEGECNRLARSAAEDIVHNPGKSTFNPLYLYGPSGVGKTHLCHAIGNQILLLFPKKRVLYVSAYLFLHQYTDAVRKNTVNDFLHFYQQIDVLLIDDIQELLFKDKTQDTFFHVFNHLHRLDKQLVLTSDKPPVQLDGMEDRLVTRLKWGLTAELLPPDLPLRKRIIAKKIEETNIAVPDSIADYIADKVSANIRDIEGVMISLAAEAKLNKRPIDLPLVRRIVARTVSVRIEAPTIPRIRETVCRYYNIDHAVLQTPSRKHEIVQARQVAMYLAKKYTNSSLSAIGNEIGRRDHASVVYAVKAVQNQMEVDKQLRAAIETIENLIKVS